MDFRWLLILSSVVGLGKSYTSRNNYYLENERHKYCDDLSPYFGEINLDQIAGVWHGVEKIPHLKGEYKIERTRDCLYIDIREVYVEPQPPTPYPPPLNTPYLNRNYGQYNYQEPHRIRHFVLEWHEGLWKDEYHIKVNTSHKGFWPTDLPNSAVDNMYSYFGGVIQVLKMSNNYLVLNFCMRLPHSQLYSVILSRSENQLTPETLANIHNIFTMKQLSTSTLQRVCDSGAAALNISGILFFVFVIVKWAL